MRRIFQRPYVYWTISIFLVYEVLNFFISGFNKTLELIIKYASTVNWFELIISLILSLGIGIFIAINAVYVYILYNERQRCGKYVGATGVGVIGGLATGFCPLCVSGLLPLILGLFGVSFSFASLPFQGIEVQAIVLVILLVNFYYLKKR